MDVSASAVLEQVSDAVMVLDRTGRIHDANRASERVMGYPVDRLVGEEATVFIHEADRDHVRGQFLAAIANPGEEPLVTEYRLVLPDGERRWLESVWRNPASEGPVDGLVVTTRDVSHRKEVEAELEAAERRHRTVLEHITDTVLITDDDGAFTYVCPNVSFNFGYDHDTVAEMETVEDLLGPGIPEPGSLAPGETVENVEIEAPDNVGETHTLLVTARGVDIEGGTTLYTCRDITARKRYEDRLAAQRHRLDLLNQLIRHDIRNDMTVIYGFAALLREDLDDEAADRLDRIQATADHTTGLTRTAGDLVESIRVGGDVDLEPIALAPTLHEEIDRARRRYPRATIDVVGEFPAVTVAATPLVTSVFRNLLNNAVVHSDTPDPQVEVSASVQREEVIVSVVDDGPGVPTRVRETLFERDDEALAEDGHGIGLSLVATLVDGFGGDVWYEESEPRGSAFRVALPLFGDD